MNDEIHLGGTLSPVATKYPRIQVTKTPELSDALGQGAAMLGAEMPESKLVSELAIRGAEQLKSDERRRRQTKADLIAQLKDAEGFDRAALAEVRDLYAKR